MKKHVLAFVRKHWLDPECIAISVSYALGGIGEQNLKEIQTVKKAEGVPLDVSDLCRTFENLAEVHVSDLPGEHTYVLTAHHKNDTTFSQPFTEHGAGSGVHDPSEKGFMAQIMRHNETIFRTSLCNNEVMLERAVGLMDKMGQMLDNQQKRANELAEENADSFRIVRDIIIQKAQDSTDHELRIMKAKQSSDIWKKITELAPVAINKLFGEEIIPQSTADTALIETLAEHINQEQIEFLAGSNILPPLAMGMLMDRLHAAYTKKHPETALATTDPNPSIPGAEDGTIEPD